METLSSTEERQVVPAEREPDAAVAKDGGVITVGRILWPVALSLAVLGLIAALTFHPDQFTVLIREVNPWLLLAAVASVVLRVILGGVRLSYVSRGNLSIHAGIRGQIAWDFFSNITPSAIGGGPVAALYVARDQRIAVGEATAIFLFSMLLDQFLFALIIPLLVLAMSYVPVFPVSLGTVGTGAFVLLFTGLLLWVVIFAYAVLIRPDLIQKVAVQIVRIKWLRRYRERVLDEMHQLRRRTRILRLQPAVFYVKGVLLTLGVWFMRFILPVLIVWSVYPSFDNALAFVRTVALSIGTIILPTPGGSGGVEGLYALFLGPMMPKALLAPTLLVWRLLGYYLLLAVGVYVFIYQIRKERAQGRTPFGIGKHSAPGK